MILRLLQTLNQKYNHWFYYGWAPRDSEVERRVEEKIRISTELMFLRARGDKDEEVAKIIERMSGR